MRYGENIIEAKENKDWVCPTCRGICNCSSCRRAKGWRPTGAIYRKVVGLGFKSVAHYLVKTWGPHADQKEEAGASSIYRAQSIPQLPQPYKRNIKKPKVTREWHDNNADQDYNSELDEDDADDLTEDEQDNDYEPNEKEEEEEDDELNGYEFETPDIVSGQ